MLRRLLLFFLVCAECAMGQTTIPATPAGQALAAWLDAFNSGDHAKMETYVKKFEPKNNADHMMGFRSQTGGFELLAIEKSEPLAIKFRVKEKNSPTVAIGSITVKDAQSGMVDEFGLRAIPPGTKEEDITLDGPTRSEVISGAITQLKANYVYPELAEKMADALLAHQMSGDYDKITDGSIFADKLTEDLQAVSHDKHLHVNYAPFKLPPDHEGGPSPEDEARFRKDMERNNCGFDKVEVLPGNIGYVKFNMFAPPDICGPTVVAGMNFLAHVDALIFDLRENGGGDPKMVAFIASYLFDEPTHLSDIYDRPKDFTTQYWTLSYVPGTRLPKAPAYVLTSSSTFSGAEDFSYNLQQAKRVTVIGETTGGGAHPVSGHRIDDHFGIGVPFARSINVTTKTNWEGTGVTPDVKVKADDALETAKKMAADKIHEEQKLATDKAPLK
jgi:retinol-binding protein 3